MINTRLAVLLSVIIFLILWIIPSQYVWRDYQDLINQAPRVSLSIITLWVPVGLFGATVSVLAMAPKCLITGQKANQCFSPKTYQLSNKIAKYFAILGVFTAIAFAWHSFNLLDEYGYQYSSKLTKITPTGIHLVYTKP